MSEELEDLANSLYDNQVNYIIKFNYYNMFFLQKTQDS